MLTQRIANLVFTVLVIIACAWFAMIAQGFEASGLLASSGLPSKFFPQLLLGFTAACGVVVAALYLFRGHTGGDDGDTVFENTAEARRGLLVMAVAVVCYMVWRNFGFIPMAVAMGPLCLLAMGVRNGLHYIVVLALTALIYLVFTTLLNVQLT